jgi:hypothetical protein
MDINLLNLEQRSKYLWYMAERFGLDPMSKPFDAIPNKDGKLVLYANRTAAEQFRKLYRIDPELSFLTAVLMKLWELYLSVRPWLQRRWRTRS